jgi:hypothetical protein
MEVSYPHCAGLDVTKDTVVAGVHQHMANGLVKRQVRTFKTTTKELFALSGGLARESCTHRDGGNRHLSVAGVAVLSGDFALVQANAVQNVPGRKTDVNDTVWAGPSPDQGAACGAARPGHRSSLLPAAAASATDRCPRRRDIQIDREADADVAPFRAGIGAADHDLRRRPHGAPVILAKIGRDMGRFPSAGHLIAWAALCPTNGESPRGPARGLEAHGKRRSTRPAQGGAVAQDHPRPLRLGRRPIKASSPRCSSIACAPGGAKKAIAALAASILTITYHMLIAATPDHDGGPDRFDRTAKTARTRRLITRLQHLGYAVQITPWRQRASLFLSASCKRVCDPQGSPNRPGGSECRESTRGRSPSLHGSAV